MPPKIPPELGEYLTKIMGKMGENPEFANESTYKALKQHIDEYLGGKGLTRVYRGATNPDIQGAGQVFTQNVGDAIGFKNAADKATGDGKVYYTDIPNEVRDKSTLKAKGSDSMLGYKKSGVEGKELPGNKTNFLVKSIAANKKRLLTGAAAAGIGAMGMGGQADAATVPQGDEIDLSTMNPEEVQQFLSENDIVDESGQPIEIQADNTPSPDSVNPRTTRMSGIGPVPLPPGLERGPAQPTTRSGSMQSQGGPLGGFMGMMPNVAQIKDLATSVAGGAANRDVGNETPGDKAAGLVGSAIPYAALPEAPTAMAGAAGMGAVGVGREGIKAATGGKPDVESILMDMLFGGIGGGANSIKTARTPIPRNIAPDPTKIIEPPRPADSIPFELGARPESNYHPTPSPLQPGEIEHQLSQGKTKQDILDQRLEALRETRSANQGVTRREAQRLNGTLKGIRGTPANAATVSYGPQHELPKTDTGELVTNIDLGKSKLGKRTPMRDNIPFGDTSPAPRDTLVNRFKYDPEFRKKALKAAGVVGGSAVGLTALEIYRLANFLRQE